MSDKYKLLSNYIDLFVKYMSHKYMYNDTINFLINPEGGILRECQIINK